MNSEYDYPETVDFLTIYDGEPPRMTLNGTGICNGDDFVTEDVIHVVYKYPFQKDHTFRHISCNDHFQRSEIFDAVVEQYSSMYLDTETSNMYPMIDYYTDLNKMRLCQMIYSHHSDFDNSPVYKLKIRKE